ncbi:hypothetical protein DFA_11394 [Cavenderia fasciculata]|uniref:ILEI/PANDER domain-containing protein n=1 Tax=Cavenderia fasciculata TaxID=261658 RepID=F4QCQ1_CACFS|nr:uncharacterized protein DFA_11394 [Cavenderia fasciculata]EGG13633.1 hypothetical protein DFA_11394 [Cavenderia fasciculata]|eukprot:XP_004350337.1 hypothetical protein DFA_11394 [Cavenderia fasciculata]
MTTLLVSLDRRPKFIWNGRIWAGFAIGSGINLWVDHPGCLCFAPHLNQYPKTKQRMNEFVEMVNSLPPDAQVAIIVYDGFLAGMQDILLPAFQSIGSTRFQEAQHYQKYCMVGRKGGSALESFGDDPLNKGEVRVETNATSIQTSKTSYYDDFDFSQLIKYNNNK